MAGSRIPCFVFYFLSPYPLRFLWLAVCPRKKRSNNSSRQHSLVFSAAFLSLIPLWCAVALAKKNIYQKPANVKQCYLHCHCCSFFARCGSFCRCGVVLCRFGCVIALQPRFCSSCCWLCFFISSRSSLSSRFSRSLWLIRPAVPLRLLV